jgi:hypothetical protein
VRDDKPFGGAGPPAAMFYYSRNRRGEHPQAHLAGYSGIFQADAFEGVIGHTQSGEAIRGRLNDADGSFSNATVVVFAAK